MVRTRAKAATAPPPTATVSDASPPVVDASGPNTDKRHCDFGALAKGGAARASKLRAKKESAISSAAKQASTTNDIVDTQTPSKQMRKQPPKKAKESPKPKEAVSDNEDEDSLGEADSDTFSSSEDDATTSDDEFIAPESDHEKPDQEIDGSSSSDSDDASSVDSDSDDDDSVQEVTPVRSKAKANSKSPAKTKTVARGKRAVQHRAPSKKSKVQSDSSDDEESDEDEPELVIPSSSKSKTRKKKAKAESEASDEDSDDDSSVQSEDKPQIAKASTKTKGSTTSPPPPTTTTVSPKTPTTTTTTPATPSPAKTTTTTSPAIGHGFMDAIFLTGATVLFVAAGKAAFKSNSAVIYVPDQESHFTVESLCTNSLVPGACYFGAFDALGRLVNMQRVNAKDTKLPPIDCDWLVVPYAVLAITGGIVFAGVVSSVDPVQERQNKYGGVSYLREISVTTQDSKDPEVFHNVFCTLWGENTKIEMREKDVILIVNAKQSSFQGIVRFTIAETSTIAIVSKMKSAKVLRKKAKKFIKKRAGGDLVLPDGCEPWKE